MIKIKQFDPMIVEMPKTDLVGKVKIQFPPVHIKLIGLRMGITFFDDVHIGTNFNPMMEMNLSKPISPSVLLTVLQETEEYWKKIWEVQNEEYNKAFENNKVLR